MKETDWIKATNQINVQTTPILYYAALCVICGCVTPVAQISKETFVCAACKSAVKWAKERMIAERKRADDDDNNRVN